MEEECCQLVSLRMSWKQAECKPCSQKPRQASLAGLQNQLLTLIAPHLFLLPKTRSVIVYRNHLPKQRVVLLLIRISKNRFIDVKYQVVKCKVHQISDNLHIWGCSRIKPMFPKPPSGIYKCKVISFQDISLSGKVAGWNKLTKLGRCDS